MTTVYTIGHSTRPIEEFIGLLREHRITQLADIRTIAKSRHNPQFAEEALDRSLADAGIEYLRLKSLGGLRSSSKDSINTAWRNTSFRNYADHMQTEAFHGGLDILLTVAEIAPTAIMCAEAVPWRCHRSLVSDALLVRGIEVRDIINAGRTSPQKLTSFAVVDGTTITYPGD